MAPSTPQRPGKRSMQVHEKYYGRAAREAAGGFKREDLWAKAVALSGGDQARAAALYVDLLAQQFAAEDASLDTVARRDATVEAAAIVGKAVVQTGRRASAFALRWLIWLVLSLAILFAFGGAITLIHNLDANEWRDTPP